MFKFLLSLLLFSNLLLASTDEEAYRAFCHKAVEEPYTWKSFKKDTVLSSYMDYGTYEDGEKLASIIREDYPHLIAKVHKFRNNDRIGKPKTYRYKDFGKISPVSLKYMKVAGDLEKLFGNLDGLKVLEIGGGYGGQCKVLKDLYKFGKYTIVDFEETIELAKIHLLMQGVSSIDFNEVKTPLLEDYDLVISNYAFSKYSKEIQDKFFEKLINMSKRGYIVSDRAEELVSLLEEKGSVSIEEMGSSSLIVWGR